MNIRDLCFLKDELNKPRHLEMITHPAGREHDRSLKDPSAAFIPTSLCIYSVCQNIFNPIKPQDVHFFGSHIGSLPLLEKDAVCLPFLKQASQNSLIG